MTFTTDRCVRFRASLTTTAMLLMIGILGCSSGVNTYPVSLHVAYEDGTTIEGAIVAFQSVAADGAKTETYSGVGKVQADGTCTLTTLEPGDGLVAGLHRATVGLPPLWGMHGQDPDEVQGTPAPPLHPRFRSTDTSELEFTVTPEGPNEFSIKLERP